MPEPTTTTTEELENVRLYIGNISKQLSQNMNALESRIAKYGDLATPIELRCKETFQDVNYFGYVNIKISDTNLKKLLSALHKVKFMNSSLKIEKAKPSFNEIKQRDMDQILESEQQAEKESALHQAKRATTLFHRTYGTENKIRRLRSYLTVIEAGVRKTPRVKLNSKKKLNISDITYRVKFPVYNSHTQRYEKKTRIIRPRFKQKLWGYDKNKHRTDLVFKFANGVWKDGNNHIVEVIKSKKKNVNNLVSRGEGEAPPAHEDIVKLSGKSLEKEKRKVKSVLDDFLSGYDFDKPIEFDYNEDRKEKLESAREKFDYEAESHNFASNFDDEDDEEVDEVEEVFNSKDIKQDEDVEMAEPGSSEALKSLFNPEGQQATATAITENAEGGDNEGGFAFHLQDSDLEEEDNLLDDVPVIPSEPAATTSSTTASADRATTPVIIQEERALFFPHFDSPFLVAQTQLNRLLSYSSKNNDNYELIASWPKVFGEQRVELMKSFKRRKRDVIRQNSKR